MKRKFAETDEGAAQKVRRVVPLKPTPVNQYSDYVNMATPCPTDAENELRRVMDNFVSVYERLDVSDDVSTKPNYSYTELVYLAILRSPNFCLPITEIYRYMQTKFSFFRNSTRHHWKNAVRHSLSKTKCFSKIVVGRGASTAGVLNRSTYLWCILPGSIVSFARGDYRPSVDRESGTNTLRWGYYRVNAGQFWDQVAIYLTRKMEFFKQTLLISPSPGHIFESQVCMMPPVQPVQPVQQSQIPSPTALPRNTASQSITQQSPVAVQQSLAPVQSIAPQREIVSTPPVCTPVSQSYAPIANFDQQRLSPIQQITPCAGFTNVQQSPDDAHVKQSLTPNIDHPATNNYYMWGAVQRPVLREISPLGSDIAGSWGQNFCAQDTSPNTSAFSALSSSPGTDINVSPSASEARDSGNDTLPESSPEQGNFSYMPSCRMQQYSLNSSYLSMLPTSEIKTEQTLPSPINCSLDNSAEYRVQSPLNVFGTGDLDCGLSLTPSSYSYSPHSGYYDSHSPVYPQCQYTYDTNTYSYSSTLDNQLSMGGFQVPETQATTLSTLSTSDWNSCLSNCS